LVFPNVHGSVREDRVERGRLEPDQRAICVLAWLLSPEVRRRAGVALGERMSGLHLSDEASDTAVATDIALIFVVIDCRQSHWR